MVIKMWEPQNCRQGADEYLRATFYRPWSQGTQEVTMVNNPVSENSEAHFTGRDCPGATATLQPDKVPSPVF